MLLYWVWFAQLGKLNMVQKLQLLQRYSDPEELYHSSESLPLPDEVKEALGEKDLASAHGLIRECEGKGIGILPLCDGAYPARLRNTQDPPLLLFYKGVLPDWEKQPVIGVVGTRKATSYGNEMAVRFGREIAGCGALVVSGGARGIDSGAMLGALEAGKPTVGVLGCGVDVVYPSENRKLFETVIENGCLLSEYPPGTKGLAWHFPARNRIISGISNGLLVVEAPDRSGALITANLALEQGRDVFSIPGNIDNPNCAGSNALLQSGATPVFSGWDVVKEYAPLWPKTVAKREVLRVAQLPVTLPETAPADKIPIDKEEKSTYSVLENIELTEEETQILSVLERSAKPLDEVIAQLDMPAAMVKMRLTKLSVKGIVVMHPGGRVSRK